VVFVLNALILLPRVALFGTDITVYTLRYFNESVYVALIVIPFAFAHPGWARAPTRPRDGQAWTRIAAALMATALVAYTAFAWASDAAFDRHWPGREAKVWADNMRGDLDRLERARAHPVVLDGPVPRTIVPLFALPKEHPPPN
jgi:hypothetical protein